MKKLIPILVIIASTLLIAREALSLPSCSGDVWNNCFGTYTYTTGDKYTGEWENNLVNGKGTYIWVTGEQYSGEWENDEFNGLGTYTNSDGTSQYGIWGDGEYLFGAVFYRIELSGDCPTGSWKPADVCEKLPDNCRPDKSRKNSAKCGRKIEQSEVLTVVANKQSI